MPISGKYNFKGIKEKGAGGLKLALLSSPYTSWVAKIPTIDVLLEFVTNWMANKGLIVMNIGAIIVDGKVDQSLLDRSMEAGLKEVEMPGVILTPERMKEIDDEVIKAARRALPYVRAVK